MTTTLKLDNNKTTVDFGEGHYDIYIVGGLDIEANSLIVGIINKTNRQEIKTFEHKFKFRSFRAVRYFYFDIPNADTYEVSIYNYNKIVLRKSRLLIFRLFQSPLNIADIRIRIEKG